MKFDRRWLLAPPLLAVLLVSGPFAVDGTDRRILIVALGGVALALAATMVVLRPRSAPDRTAPRATGPISIRHTHSLARGGHLHVVRFEGRDLLVAEDRTGGVRLLAESDRTPTAPASTARAVADVEIPRTARPRARIDGYRALARSDR